LSDNGKFWHTLIFGFKFFGDQRSYIIEYFTGAASAD
jgi:hypothetical protein